jgi:hypothetical protein
MSALARQSVGWSRRQWSWIVAGGLLVHAGLVFWLGEKSQPLAVVSAPAPLLAMVVTPLPELTDPALFALPSHDGFSGGAWLRLAPATPPPSGWTEPPAWLPLDTNELGAVFLRYVATNKHNGAFMEEMLKPRVSTADILLLNDTLMTQSVVRLEGPLAGRPLVAPLTLGNPAYPEVLAPTIVQLRVNADGLTESAILVGGCGLKQVDEEGLAVARRARFLPVPPAPDAATAQSTDSAQWGKMVFQWCTVPPAVTNTPPRRQE